MPGFIKPRGSKMLERAHRLVKLRPEDHLVQLGALQSVTVLAAHHPAEAVRHLGAGVGHFAHDLDAALFLEIDQRADMQATGGGMRVIGGASAISSDHFLDRATYSARCSTGTETSSITGIGL